MAVCMTSRWVQLVVCLISMHKDKCSSCSLRCYWFYFCWFGPSPYSFFRWHMIVAILILKSHAQTTESLLISVALAALLPFVQTVDLICISHNGSKPIPLLFTHFHINITSSVFGRCSSLFYWTIHCIFWCVFFHVDVFKDHSNDGRDTCQSSIMPKKQNIINTFTFQGSDWALSTL